MPSIILAKGFASLDLLARVRDSKISYMAMSAFGVRGMNKTFWTRKIDAFRIYPSKKHSSITIRCLMFASSIYPNMPYTSFLYLAYSIT